MTRVRLTGKNLPLPLFHIEMKMTLVSFIGIRPKHRAEGFARLIVHKLQKIPFAIAPADRYSLHFECLARYATRIGHWQRRIDRTLGPVLDHSNLLSRVQHEIGDVERVSECMFAQRLIGTVIADRNSAGPTTKSD